MRPRKQGLRCQAMSKGGVGPAQGPSGMGWRGSLGGGKLGRGPELEPRQRGDGHREPGEQSTGGLEGRAED